MQFDAVRRDARLTVDEVEEPNAVDRRRAGEVSEAPGGRATLADERSRIIVRLRSLSDATTR